MTNKHTQGQWEYFEQNHYKDIRAASINKKGHKEYIKITQYDGNKANARLIAAAPDLLEALEELLYYNGESPNAVNAAREKAFIVINKARGD